MKQTVIGEAPFQVLATNFSIGPSQEGYTLQISADGSNFSDLFSVGAGVTRMVTGVANGSYYRMDGNESDVVINWRTQCNDGEGGGGGSYVLPPATQSTLGGIKVGSGLTITNDGTLSSEGGSGEGVVYVSHLSDADAVAAPVGTLIVLNEEEDNYQEHSIYIKVEGGEIASLKGYSNPAQAEPFEIVYDELEEFVNFCDGKLMFTVKYNGTRYAYMDAANLAIIYYSDEQKTTELARLEYGGTARFGTSINSRYVDLSWEDNVIYFRKASNLESVQNIINFSTEGVHYHRITDNTKATAQNLGLGTEFMYGIPEWNNEGIIVKKKFNGENQYTQINYGQNNYSNRIGFVVADGASFLPNRMYIPTAAGTQGQVLTFDTINTAPVWATIIKAQQITSAAYEALVQAGTTDPNTLYLIVDE